jgi:hypothetical protein
MRENRNLFLTALRLADYRPHWVHLHEPSVTSYAAHEPAAQASNRIVIKQGAGADKMGGGRSGELGLNWGYDANQNNFVFIRPANTLSYQCTGASF